MDTGCQKQADNIDVNLFFYGERNESNFPHFTQKYPARLSVFLSYGWDFATETKPLTIHKYSFSYTLTRSPSSDYVHFVVF